MSPASETTGSSVTTVMEDPRFVQGRLCLNEGRFEEAIEFFSSLLQTCIENFGEMTPATARAYYEYGNALLTKEEESSANGVLGNIENKEGAAEFDEVGEEDEQQEEEEEGAEDGVEEDAEAEGGDVQIAWETLDLARAILEKSSDKDRNLLLSKVYVRLGDLRQFNEDISGSLEEYKSALKIREVACEPSDRDVSSIHYTLATAHLYNSKEKDISDPIAEMEKAKTHYTKSKAGLELWLANKSSVADSTETAEVTELVDVLKETLTSLDEELAELKKNNGKPAIPQITTTIGFGTSATKTSSSSSSSAPAAFSSSSSTAASQDAKRPNTDVNTLAVKKRKT